MMSFSGSIVSRSGSPQLYAIVKAYCLYIGETQQQLAARWGQHLGPEGSFSKNLLFADEEIYWRNQKIWFFGFALDKVAELSEEEHKIVTQYVEHRVHEHCILEMPSLNGIELIISDTTRTAPKSCLYPWATVAAKEVFQSFRKELNSVRGSG